MLFSIVSWSMRREIKRERKNARSPKVLLASGSFPFRWLQVFGILGAEASELLKIILSADLSAAAICYELVPVGAFVMGAAASELLYSVLLAAGSRALLQGVNSWCLRDLGGCSSV